MKIKLFCFLCLAGLICPSCEKDSEKESLRKTYKCIFIGDSITENWTTEGYDPEFFTSHSFLNSGKGGETTQDMLDRFDQDVTFFKPVIVVIMAGVNDIARNDGYISNESIMKNITEMCERAAVNHIKVILCSVMPVYQFNWKTTLKPVPLILDLNRRIKSYAESKAYPYADYYSAFVDERGGLPAIYSTDEVHPTKACYKIMESMILEVINKTLN